MALDYEQINNIRNIGAKSFNEIEKLKKEIVEKEKLINLVSANDNSDENIKQKYEKAVIFFDSSGTPRRDIPLDEINLSRRSEYVLKNAGYKFASELLGVTAERLKTLPHTDRACIREIISNVSGLKFEAAAVNGDEYTQAQKGCVEFVSLINNLIPTNMDELYRTLLPFYKSAYENNTPVDKDILFNQPVLRKHLTDKIITVLEESTFGVNNEDIFSLFPNTLVPVHTINAVLRELSADGKIRTGRTIEINRPDIWEYVGTIPNEKYRVMFALRLQGKTLEEIGNAHGLTRERVRQIVAKCLHKKKITVEEDKYRKIYESYSFSKENFALAFNTEGCVYTYLTLVCDKQGLLPIERFIGDTEYPAELREGAERAVNKDHFIINGIRVLKQRPALADYVARTYFQDEAFFDDFVISYNNVLQDLGLVGDSRFMLNSSTYQNRISEAENILWKYQGRFRYYDTTKRDFADLLEGLNLEQYTDVEYSSLKFYRLYPELMKKYDLRDEYELHNLLRKLYSNKETEGISFSRMPIIAFGNIDREKQVIEFLERLAPIGVNDFCDAYEAEYGVLARTVKGSFLSYIDKFKDSGGIYNTGRFADRGGHDKPSATI
uniref:RNA polymerase sigma-70 region 4 domain-containing protein n=1 Tax=uncultured bacterium contig00025 TaxID=1181514 RepID=A0A806K0Y5_9BACT|nr:hypothetical protein [uncultured bacterium contig00025]